MKGAVSAIYAPVYKFIRLLLGELNAWKNFGSHKTKCALRPRLIHVDLRGILSAMSYKTLEVELENGRVRPAGAETLPDKAHALLTILSPQAVKPNEPAKSLGKAMRDLAVVGWGEFVDLSTNPRHMDDFRR